MTFLNNFNLMKRILVLTNCQSSFNFVTTGVRIAEVKVRPPF